MMNKIQKILLLSGLLLFLGPSLPLFANHYKPFYKKENYKPLERQGRIDFQSRSEEAEIVVDEDFCLFKNGSEESPVPVNMDGYFIPENLTAQPGWMGRGIAEAGEACAVMYYTSDYYGRTEGYIDTPEMYLYGTVTLSFRAKVLNGEQGSIWVPLCDAYDGPVDSETFILSDQWQTFTYTSTAATSYDCYYQFTPEKCEILLDEVIVSVTHDKVQAPYTLLPDNISLTAFRANWESIVMPDKFILNVYSLEAPETVEKGIIEEKFENINVEPGTDLINQESPNYPAGWTIEAINITEGPEDSQALLLSNEGELIESPESPLPIKELSFWVKPTNMKSEDYFISLLQVSVFNGEWTAIANIPNYWLNSNGGLYSFEPAAIGEGVSKIKISYFQKGAAAVGFAIDDIMISYETPDNKIPFMDPLDIPATANSWKVENIDPEKNYYYTVNSVINGVISPASHPQWVDGINGLTPMAQEPELVSENGFTARWERLPHAQLYQLRLQKLSKAESFMEDVTVLEENFDKITEGTLSNPGYDFISPFNFGANGMANSDWMATQPRWIEGMAGSDGTSWFGAAGLVASPYLSLTNDGGAFDVEFSALSIVENDEIFCLIIDDINTSEALEGQSLNLGSANQLGSTKLHFDKSDRNRSNIMIAFMSKSGFRFFVDYVRISQNLQPGESLSSIYTTEQVKENYYEFSDLPADSDYSYSVVATAYNDFTDYESKRSNEVEVKMYSSIESKSDNLEISYIFDGSTLEFNGLKNGMFIQLFDMTGRLIGARYTDAEGCCRIPCNSGLYVVRIGYDSKKVFLQ